jgi:hypothetical protein
MAEYFSSVWLHSHHARSLDELQLRPDIVALRIVNASLPDMERLSSLPQLQRLDLIGVQTSSIEILSHLPELLDLRIIGCPFEDPRPLLKIPKLKRCVLRCIPWSQQARAEVFPLLQQRVTVEMSTDTQWLLTLDSSFFLGSCVESVGQKRSVVFFPGADGALGGGPFLVSSAGARRVIAIEREQSKLVDLVNSEGVPGATWLDNLLSDISPPDLSTGERLAELTQLALPAALDGSLRRYVSVWSALGLRPERVERSAIYQNAHPVLRALLEVVGRWQLASRPEIRFNTQLKNKGAWWRWYPDGAWGSVDPGPGGKPMVGIAIDEVHETGLWVEADPGSAPAVWKASISDHEPGRPLDESTMLPFAPSLAALLDAISAVRLPDGTIIEATPPASEK